MTSNGITLDFRILYKNEVMASKHVEIDYGHHDSTLTTSFKREGRVEERERVIKYE